jgi:hypothetical protein
MPKKYNSLYERMIANAFVNESGCWIWTGHTRGGYPNMSMRRSGGNPRGVLVHRVMLEEFWEIDFPFDEAGHLCCNPLCINPHHLEVQTRALNLALRRNGSCSAALLEKQMVPTIFPREDTAPWRDFSEPHRGKPVPRALDPLRAILAADDGVEWDHLGEPHPVGEPCPF